MIIKTTEAAVLWKNRSPLIIDEIELPDTLGVGQVLVELITSGVCGAQLNEIDAVKGPDKFLPHLLGHEGFCKILDIGPGVKYVKCGDLAIMHWRPGNGIQSEPPKYRWRGKSLNAGWVTTFNRHAVISENRLTRIGQTAVSKTILPLLGCALTTALGVLEKDLAVSIRDKLLIFGAGGVGLSVINIANFLGVRDITVVDLNEKKLNVAQKMGAVKTVFYENKTQCQKDLINYFAESPPNIAIETSGRSSAIEICYEVSANQAKVLLVGVPRVGDKASIYTLPLHFGKTFKGSEGGQSYPAFDIPFLLKEMEKKNLNLDNFPTSIYGFKNLNNAIDDLRLGFPGRMVVDFDSQK